MVKIGVRCSPGARYFVIAGSRHGWPRGTDGAEINALGLANLFFIAKPINLCDRGVTLVTGRPDLG